MSESARLNKETYDRIAEDWNKDHSNDTWWIEGTEALVKMLPQGGSVLDVGCGSGTKTRFLADKGLQAAGTDLSEKMIEIAKRENPEHEFYIADMHDLGTVPGEYDGVFAQASLLHVPKSEVDAVIEEFKKKLKSGGLLYVAVKGRREGEPEETMVTENDYGYDYERFFSYFTLEELRRYFAKHGIETVYEHVETMGRRDWLQIIGRKS